MKHKNIFRFLGTTNSFVNRLLGIEDEQMLKDVNGLNGPNKDFGPINPMHGQAIPHDTLIVHDVSTSFSWKDCKPSRMGASKLAIEEYIIQRAAISTDDRIGLVSFNTHGRTVLPFTSISQQHLIIKRLKSLRAGGGTNITAGLKEAKVLFSCDLLREGQYRLRKLLLTTDGQGGHPLKIAKELKSNGILIEVIGVGGSHSEVNENLLRKVATTDDTGTHYRHIYDTEQLVAHYQELATGLVWRNSDK